MRLNTLWLGLLGGLVMLSVSACGFGYYKAMSQPAGPADQVKAATAFKVRPLKFAGISYTDLGYENEAQMKEEFATFASDFASHFKDMWQTEKVPPKAVAMVGAADPVADGILVEVVVDRIQLNWNMFSNVADDFFVTITFTDAAQKAQLFTGQYQVKNTAFSQGFGQSMQGRLNNAAYNICWLLIKIMSYGVAMPAEY
jgi:hypothetical protein